MPGNWKVHCGGAVTTKDEEHNPK